MKYKRFVMQILAPLLLGIIISYAVGNRIALKSSSLYVYNPFVPFTVIDTNDIPAGYYNKDILERNVFNVTVGNEQTLSDTTEVNRDSNIQLIGLVKGSPNFALVLMGGEYQTLRSDRFVNSCIIRKVSIDTVDIECEGSQEIFSFKIDGNSVATGVERKEISPSTSSTQDEGSGYSRLPSRETPTGSYTTLKLDKEAIKGQFQDLSKILTTVELKPYYVEGELMGYRITQMRDDSPLVHLNLEAGDIVAGLNGRVPTPTVLLSIITNIENVDALTVDVIRDGQRLSFYLEAS